MQTDRPDERRIGRRAALLKLAAGTTIGAAAIVTSTRVVSAASCCTSTAAAVLIPTCQPNTPHTGASGECVRYWRERITICRTSTTQTMLLAGDSLGLTQPYFDELAVVRITSPTGTRNWVNVIRWQADCRRNNATDIFIVGGSACGPLPGPAIDLTFAFGNECGLFDVRLDVRNGFTPYGYSTCWIVPA